MRGGRGVEHLFTDERGGPTFLIGYGGDDVGGKDVSKVSKLSAGTKISKGL